MALIGLVCLLAGCGPRNPGEQSFDPAEYGKLAGLKASGNLQLRDELARIADEGGTPEQLGRCDVPEEENAAVALRAVFPPQKVKSLWEASEKIDPPRGFAFDPIRLQKAIRFRTQHEPERRKAQEALSRPKCAFAIPFHIGYYADASFGEGVRLCARLEAFRAAESLADGDVTAAIDSLTRMLRLAACLAAEKHIVPRLDAVQIRTGAFAVLQSIVKHEKFSRRHLDRVAELVAEQWKAWPSDAAAWIGDRALGMYAYEMVRAGQLIRLLTDSDIERFHEERILAEMSDAARRVADTDELFYLDAMRRIIESCGRPYYERAAVFDAIDAELRSREDTPEYPLVAARLLLPKIRDGHAVQARDRANWQAWMLALALATGRNPLPYRVNPLSGKPYQSAKHGQGVEVRGVGTSADDDSPIELPIP
jgi:hypothetical protein